MKLDDVDSLLNDFYFHCKYEKNLSDKTLKAYRIDHKQFLSFFSQATSSRSVSLIDKHVIKGYLKFISDKFKPKTIKRKVASLKSFFNYLEYEDAILLNPFRKIRINIKEGKQVPRTIETSVIKRLFKHVYGLKEGSENRGSYSYRALIRDIAVLELLFSTGIRVSELCNLLYADVEMSRGSLRIVGKGNKERIVPICNVEATSSIRAYWQEFREEVTGEGFFFINRLSNRLSEQSVRLMIKKYIGQLNIDENITPHMFRHSVATLLMENEVDIRYIQSLLGHSSINTTQIYLQVNKKTQRKILTKKHPRSKL